MKQKYLSLFYLLILSLVAWWFSSHVVWLGDDLDYKYMMRGELWQSSGNITSVKGFFQSQITHYLHVNGRFVAHSLVQLFNAFLGQQAFAVCNALVYALFAFLIGKAGKVNVFSNSGGILSAIILSVLCFVTKMMPTCQIGYIWGMVANIIWLSYFYKSSRPTWTATIAMSFLGIIVGNWQESISIGVCAGIGVWWIIHLVRCRKYLNVKFDWRRSWMIAGYVVGTAFNCLSPSTIGRTGGSSLPLIDQLLIGAYSVIAIVILVVAIIVFKRSKNGFNFFSFKSAGKEIPNGVLTAAMLALLLFNLAIGVYSNRQLFGANLFAAIQTLRILPKHRFNMAINIVGVMTVIALWAVMMIGVREVKRQYDEIVNLYAESSDGRVYYDRQRVMTLGFPLRSKYYEDILGQFDNDLHHSMMKDFGKYGKKRALKLFPARKIEGEEIAEYVPGHFYVSMKTPGKGEGKRKVIVYGHYPFKIKATPRTIEVAKFSKRNTTHSMAVIIPEFPFFTADSIQIMK